MADLRRVMRGMLRDYGHDILLQRRQDLPDPGPHPVAQFTNKLERHTTRHMHARSANLSFMGDERLEGLVTTVDLVYFFLHDVDPKEGDRIYEQDDRYPAKFSTLLVDYAQPMKGRRGRMEFWVAGVTREGPH